MKRLSLLVVLMLVGCANVHHERASQPYVHVVMMWLKNPGNADDRQKLIATAQSFVGKIPGLISVSSGPVRPSTRPVVDSTYDVGIVMVFKSEETLAKYPTYPVHQRAVEEVIKPLVERYVVYDFQDAGLK